MAIYNVDAINEQNEVVDTETVLDNMLEACDTMMSALGEGAYRKYMNMQADKQDELLAKAKKYKDLSEKLTGKAAVKAENKYRQAKDAARDMYDDQNSKGYVSNLGNTGSIRDDIESDGGFARKYGYGYGPSRDAKSEWMKDHGDIGEDKIGNRKPGTFASKDEKKKAIKETCLNILSVIDEL